MSDLTGTTIGPPGPPSRFRPPPHHVPVPPVGPPGPPSTRPPLRTLGSGPPLAGSIHAPLFRIGSTSLGGGALETRSPQEALAAVQQAIDAAQSMGAGSGSTPPLPTTVTLTITWVPPVG